MTKSLLFNKRYISPGNLHLRLLLRAIHEASYKTTREQRILISLKLKPIFFKGKFEKLVNNSTVRFYFILQITTKANNKKHFIFYLYTVG